MRRNASGPSFRVHAGQAASTSLSTMLQSAPGASVASTRRFSNDFRAFSAPGPALYGRALPACPQSLGSKRKDDGEKRVIQTFSTPSSLQERGVFQSRHAGLPCRTALARFLLVAASKRTVDHGVPCVPRPLLDPNGEPPSGGAGRVRQRSLCCCPWPEGGLVKQVWLGHLSVVRQLLAESKLVSFCGTQTITLLTNA